MDQVLKFFDQPAKFTHGFFFLVVFCLLPALNAYQIEGTIDVLNDSIVNIIIFVITDNFNSFFLFGIASITTIKLAEISRNRNKLKSGLIELKEQEDIKLPISRFEIMTFYVFSVFVAINFTAVWLYVRSVQLFDSMFPPLIFHNFENFRRFLVGPNYWGFSDNVSFFAFAQH